MHDHPDRASQGIHTLFLPKQMDFLSHESTCCQPQQYRDEDAMMRAAQSLTLTCNSCGPKYKCTHILLKLDVSKQPPSGDTFALEQSHD